MDNEIYYCNLKVMYNGKVKEIKEVIHKKSNKFYYVKKDKKEYQVTAIDIIKIIGHENNSNDFIEVKKSDEIRDKITGTYI